MSETLVSVVMITYGHDEFINQAIEGVLMQKCDCNIELIVANDCSPDNTDLVVQRIMKNHPNSHWIKYTKHINNKGMMANFIWALQQAQGKYIALCEGDDYWVDKLKLQKQFEIMELDESIIISTHNANVLKTDASEPKRYVHENMKSKINFIDILEGCSFPTASFFFRNNVISTSEINILKKGLVGDWILILLLLRHGHLHYSNEILSVYNVHDKNVWANTPRMLQIESKINISKFIKENFNLSVEEDDLVSLNITNEKLLLIRQKISHRNFTFFKDLFSIFRSKNWYKSLVPMLRMFVPKMIKSNLKSLYSSGI